MTTMRTVLARAAAVRARPRHRAPRLGGAAAAIVLAVAFAAGCGSGGHPGSGGHSATPGSSAGPTSSASHAAGLPLAPPSSAGHLQPAPPPGPTGPEGVPVPSGPALAGLSNAATGKPVDGIRCETSEQLLFHVHTHLTIFVNGTARQIPYGIGIAPPRQVQHTPQGAFVSGGSCFYWLHTHAADGIIHIESPVHRSFTLGNFFDIWGQPLGPDRVGPATGKVTAFYNGKLYKGSPSGIPLGNHTQIQLDVGKPLIAPESITFPNGL